jgi:16S rRNA (cytidine1402-2'-O)-methyltransferase
VKIQNSFKNNSKTLYVVSTPIGNLEDITIRAIDILKKVDIILCEDTRTSINLLNKYEIKNKLISYHDHNKEFKTDYILKLLDEGNDIALISDAGTPLICDPGYELVKLLILKEYNVVSIPGASSILASLTASGLISHPFTFIGFLPKKITETKTLLTNYEKRSETLIFFDSPLRIKKDMTILKEIYINRDIVLARELTKIFETIYHFNTSENFIDLLEERGEYVVIISGKKELLVPIDTELKRLYNAKLLDNDKLKELAKIYSIKKNELYKKVLELKNN